MDNSFKRVLAYIIDFFFIALIANMLTMNSTLNPYYNKYMKYYEESVELQSSFQKEEIDEETYVEKSAPLNYNLAKSGVIINSVMIVLLISYFGIFQYFNNGQTIGKKLFKLQITSNNGKKLNIGNYLLRCIILNSILFRLLITIGPFILKVDAFNIYNYTISSIETIVECVLFVTLMLKKDGRSIHDLICNTKVITNKENTTN